MSKSLLESELTELKKICDLLDLERSGTKKEVSERILEFLKDPKSSGKAFRKVVASVSHRAANELMARSLHFTEGQIEEPQQTQTFVIFIIN